MHVVGRRADRDPGPVIRVMAALRDAGQSRDVHYAGNAHEAVYESPRGSDADPDQRSVRSALEAGGVGDVLIRRVIDRAVLVARGPQENYPAPAPPASLRKLRDSVCHQRRILI